MILLTVIFIALLLQGLVNKYISTPSGDGGKARIPVLNIQNQDGSTTEAISNDDKSIALARAFFPPPPQTHSVPANFVYSDPVCNFNPISEDEVANAVRNTSPYKAAGPDGICNIVLKRCLPSLLPYLVHLFNAVFKLQTYYDPWREFITVVLRKPGKADYSVPKAYRPIALLNTTAKILTAIVAERVTNILETHHLLPPNHFGGRPGRSTTDSVHLLEATIKDAWRSNRVASALFLDIEGAFPNAVTTQLLHNMRKRQLPLEIVKFTESMLNNRKTRLKFDDFTSEWFPVTNGIGQGDPLSMICYLIYNSDLVEVAKGRIGNRREEIALAFVDDTAFVAVAKSFEETHEILKDMLNRQGGGFEWSQTHNSRFEPNKFALIDFTRSKTKERRPIDLRNATIQPSHHHRFLGVILDQELTWKEHAAYAVGKGTEYVLQLRRLSRTSTGIPMKLMRQLYQSVAIPKFTYAADIWFRPLFKKDSSTPQRGSKGISDRLTSVQRLAALSITGAMKTTSTDSLEAHANLTPIPLLMQKICHRAAVRLASLPQSHPLYKKIRWIAKHNVISHRSSLHNLIHSFRINPEKIETIDRTKKCPPLDGSMFLTRIPRDKGDAIKEQRQLKEDIQIFTDGSGFNGGIGASAVLFRNGKESRSLRYYLGPEDEHTVYEAEVVGLTLAIQLLATEQAPKYPASIFADNQAAIRVAEQQDARGSQFLARQFTRMTKRLAKTNRDNFQLTLRWIPGHSGVEGNETADREAKKASEGSQSNSTKRRLPKYLRGGKLLQSPPALLALQKKSTQAKWTELWKKSPRYTRINAIDPSMPSNGFIKLTDGLPKRSTSLLIQLRTHHAAVLPMYTAVEGDIAEMIDDDVLGGEEVQAWMDVHNVNY